MITLSPSATRNCARRGEAFTRPSNPSQKSKATVQGKELIAEARKLATQVPINDKRAADKEVAGAFKSKSGLKAQLETEWENFARSNYIRAKELADKASASAR